MFMIVLFFLVVGFLAGCLPGKSVCDDKEAGPSLLCDTCEKNGWKLENIGFGLKVASTGFMIADIYTPAQLVKVLKEIKVILDDPVSYVFVKTSIENKLKDFPGMFEDTSLLLNSFTSSRTMFIRDRQILIEYLDKRIAVLEPG